MSGNIHFTATGDNSDFKRMMREVKEEIADVDGSVDDLKARLSDAVSSRDFLGLKDAIEEGKIELDSLGDAIEDVQKLIKQVPEGSEEQKALLEVVDALNGEYEELAASLTHAEKAFGILRTSLITSAATIGIAVAAAAGLVIAIRAVTKEARETKKAIEDGFGAIKSQTGQWLADFQKAQALWKSAQGDVDNLNTILAEHKEVLEASGVAINNINDGDTTFINNADGVVEAIMKRATALAYEQAAAKMAQQAADEYLEAEMKIAKREEDAKTNPFAGGPQNWLLKSYEGETPTDFVQNAERDRLDKRNQRDRDNAAKDADLAIRVGTKMQEAALAARQEYEQMLKAMGLSVTGATNKEKEYQSTLDESIRRLEQYEAAMRSLERTRENNERATARDRRNVQDQIEQAKIDAMQEGFEKQEAQRRLSQERELRSIEDAKEAYIRAVQERARAEFEAEEKAKKLKDPEYKMQAFDPSSLTIDTSAYDRLYKSILDKQQNDLINPLLEQYKSYEDRRKDILTRGSEEVKRLLGAGYTKEAAEARRHMKQQLEELDRQYGETASLIFRDPDKMNIVQVQRAIELAQQELERVTATPESAKDNAAYVDQLRQALERLKGVSNDFSARGILGMLFSSDQETGKGASFKERIEALKDAWANMSSDDKWKNVGGWVQNIAAGLQRAAASMIEIAEASGDSHLADTAKQLSAVAQNFAAAGGGAATGGWIGAIVGGVSDLLSQTLQAFTETKVAEAENVQYAKDWAMAIRNVNVEMQEISETFGERQLAKGREGMRSSIEAMRRYQEEMQSLNDEYNNQRYSPWKDTDKYTGWDLFLPIIGSIGYRAANMDTIDNQFKAYRDAIQKGYDGIQRMLVNTTNYGGWSKFWGKQDEFQALADLYPELFKDGELVVENAKKLLETNNKLSETQRKEIENVIELKEAYEEAVQAVDDSINSIFGSIASDVTDIIWDSVVNGGGNAWERFRELGGEAVTAIGKQLIQEMIISEYLEQFRQQMRDAYAADSAAETQASLRNIVGQIFDGMGAMLEAGSVVAQEYQDWAAEHGFDLAETSEKGRTAVAKAMTSVSQESWDVVDGKVTNIMMRLLDVDDRFAAVQDVQYRMLEQVGTIAGHTARLERIDNNMNSMRTELEDIRTRGIKISQL